MAERGFEGGAAPNEGSGEQGSGAASASAEKEIILCRIRNRGGAIKKHRNKDVITKKESTAYSNGHLNPTGPNAASDELFIAMILFVALNVTLNVIGCQEKTPIFQSQSPTATAAILPKIVFYRQQSRG